MKEAFYFPHDYNAQRDLKMSRMVREHGWQAYGLYWAIVERLYEHGGKLPEDYELLAYELRVEPAEVQRIVTGFDLFYVRDGSFGSASLDRRLQERNERAEKGRQSASRRWGNGAPNGYPMATHRVPNANPMLERKERKEKKESMGALPRFTEPSLEEVRAYCNERRNGVDPEKWLAHYQAKGWMIGKSRMKDWRAAVRTWERNETQAPAPAPVEKKCRRCHEPKADLDFDGDLCAECIKSEF